MQLFKDIIRRGRGKRIALVIQIDNLSALTAQLGPVGSAAILAALSTRVGNLMGVVPPATMGPEGQIALVAKVRGEDAVRHKAAGLREIVRSSFDQPPSGIQPRFRTVLLRGDRAQSDMALLETARRYLFAAVGSEDMVFHLFPAERGTGEAFDSGKVEPYFQPQLCCHTGAVTGFDLSARYIDRLRGIASAVVLQSLDPGERSVLTRTMLGKGLDALGYWAGAGAIIDTISLRVLASDLSDPYFVDFLSWELDRQDISPSRLVIALADEALQRGTTVAVRETLTRLSQLGCGIDLTGFGTGFASLEALRQLPINRVRIDRSFVADCDNDPSQQRMILAILALADRMGVNVLADGVQRPAQHAFLAQIGCSHVQGPAISPPLTLNETLHFLASHRAQNADLPVIRRRA